MKILRIVLLALVILVAGLVWGKNLVAKAAITGGVKAITGLETRLDKMTVGIRTPVVGMTGFKILNPSGYPDKVMLSMPELFVNYDLPAFFKGGAHLRVIRLNLEEFVVVKRADGQVNIKQIKALQQRPSQQKQAQRRAQGKPPELRIDQLELIIGRVVYKDYTRAPAMVQEFPLNIKERYEHVDDPYALAGIVVSKALMHTTIARLANFDLASLQTGVNDTLRSSAAFAAQAADKALYSAQGMGKNAVNTTREMLANPTGVAGEVGNTGRQAVGAAKDASDALKKLFKNQQ